jgi:haloacid dehalogenase-like hydrolase
MPRACLYTPIMGTRHGITVGVDGHTVRVGSARFMTHEGIALPAGLLREMDAAHEEGNSLVMVGVDDALGGAIELGAAERPEAAAVIAGLRARGAKHLAIISGDSPHPTRARQRPAAIEGCRGGEGGKGAALLGLSLSARSSGRHPAAPGPLARDRPPRGAQCSASSRSRASLRR